MKHLKTCLSNLTDAFSDPQTIVYVMVQCGNFELDNRVKRAVTTFLPELGTNKRKLLPHTV